MINHGVLGLMYEIKGPNINELFVEAMSHLLYTLTPFEYLVSRQIINYPMFDESMVRRTVNNMGDNALKIILNVVNNEFVAAENLVS